MFNRVKTALLLCELRTEIGIYVDATTVVYMLTLLLSKLGDAHLVLEVQKFNQDGPWSSPFIVSVYGRPLYDQRSGEVFVPQEHWD